MSPSAKVDNRQQGHKKQRWKTQRGHALPRGQVGEALGAPGQAVEAPGCELERQAEADAAAGQAVEAVAGEALTSLDPPGGPPTPENQNQNHTIECTSQAAAEVSKQVSEAKGIGGDAPRAGAPGLQVQSPRDDLQPSEMLVSVEAVDPVMATFGKYEESWISGSAAVRAALSAGDHGRAMQLYRAMVVERENLQDEIKGIQGS